MDFPPTADHIKTKRKKINDEVLIWFTAVGVIGKYILYPWRFCFRRPCLSYYGRQTLQEKKGIGKVKPESMSLGKGKLGRKGN